jgi:hypothetical protein
MLRAFDVARVSLLKRPSQKGPGDNRACQEDGDTEDNNLPHVKTVFFHAETLA